MCVELKKEDYEELYYNFEERLRYYLMNLDDDYTKLVAVRQMQGYEMLRIAWMAWMMDSSLTEEDMLKTVRQHISVRTAKVQVEESKNKRDSLLQKMIEVVRALGKENASPLEFVREL